MITDASAATTVDSATTETVTTPASPAFDAGDQHTWSPAQRDNWNKTGAQPTKADSATATEDEKKKTAATSDSATDKDKTKSADTASDSATEKDQKPHLKTKEDTDRRFGELLDRLKKAEQRAEAAERGKSSDTTRDTKQASQPAAETYQPLTEKQFFTDNPKAEYQDYLRAAAKHEAKWEVKQELAAERQRNAQAEAAKDLAKQVETAKTRYPDLDMDNRILPAMRAIAEDPQVPFAVKEMINGSPAFMDLVYVLSDKAALADLIQTAKTNPAAAIRKIVLTEQLVMAELAKAKTSATDDKDKTDDNKGGDGKTRDASGKFVSSDKSSDAASDTTKPRAPKPPSEVGGRGTASEDVLATAAKKGDFRSFEAEQNRRMKARSA